MHMLILAIIRTQARLEMYNCPNKRGLALAAYLSLFFDRLFNTSDFYAVLAQLQFDLDTLESSTIVYTHSAHLWF